jgi:hypothetical protein
MPTVLALEAGLLEVAGLPFDKEAAVGWDMKDDRVVVIVD